MSKYFSVLFIFLSLALFISFMAMVEDKSFSDDCFGTGGPEAQSNLSEPFLTSTDKIIESLKIPDLQ